MFRSNKEDGLIFDDGTVNLPQGAPLVSSLWEVKS